MAGYGDLKQLIEAMARNELRKTRPVYVTAFQGELLSNSADLQRATKVAHQHLGDGLPRWPKLLSALFDMEYVRSKVANAHGHLQELVDSDDSAAGYWFSYHVDHWIFEADAFVNRCMAALALCARTLIRPVDPEGWRPFLEDLRSDVQAIKDELGKVRGKWAHGGGGGVDGLIGEWEPILACPEPVFRHDEFVAQTVSSLHNAVHPRRRRLWFKAIHRSNLLIFAHSEVFSGRVFDRLTVLTSQR